MKRKTIILAYATVAMALVLVCDAGCCHRYVSEHYGMADKLYGGTEAAYQSNRTVYVLSHTLVKMWHDPDYMKRDSYLVIDLGTHGVTWADPGNLSTTVATNTPVPFENRYRGYRDCNKDFARRSDPMVVYQDTIFFRDRSTNVVWFYYPPAWQHWRDEDAYPTYYPLYGGAWVLDVVTAPVQVIGDLVIGGVGYILMPRWHD